MLPVYYYCKFVHAKLEQAYYANCSRILYLHKKTLLHKEEFYLPLDTLFGS